MTRLVLGYEVVRSYKRLSYTPWHALAEFVDNSTQAFLDNRSALETSYAESGETLRVDIEYDQSGDLIRISDNSIGMNADILDSAMTVGLPPENPTGRSRYGMGLKTAACWLGDYWTVRTTRLGVPVEYTVTVDVEHVADGNPDLPMSEAAVDTDTHYTVVEISQLNRQFRGRTLPKIRDFLTSMYRSDLRSGLLDLRWQGQSLHWEQNDDRFLAGPDGEPYRHDVEIRVDGKSITGWAGVLARGSRAQAGFSMLHSGRVVRGWPESWRPEEVFGQIEGSNDLVNQRLVGEFNLDEFEVTHTKDDILWSAAEEDATGEAIRESVADLIDVAKKARVRTKRGPSRGSIKTVTRELRERMSSAPPEPVRIEPTERAALESDSEEVTGRYGPTEPDVAGNVFGRSLQAYVSDEEPSEGLFVSVADGQEGQLVLVANMKHPFLSNVTSSEALTVYLRDLLLDVLAVSEGSGADGLSDWITTKDSMMRSWNGSANGDS